MQDGCKADLVARILMNAREGVSKTEIIYSAFLPRSQTKQLLKMLVYEGLVEYQAPEQKYLTTRTGRRFVAMYDQIGDVGLSEEMTQTPLV